MVNFCSETDSDQRLQNPDHGRWGRIVLLSHDYTRLDLFRRRNPVDELLEGNLKRLQDVTPKLLFERFFRHEGTHQSKTKHKVPLWGEVYIVIQRVTV